MELNNKGFAITTVLYGLLILFVFLVGSYMVALSVKKDRIEEVTNQIEEEYRDSLGLALGDYVEYTPVVTSYTTDKSKTNYSSTQTIYPSELSLWRVLNINDDGTIDIISEYVSSTGIHFKGKLGYQNLVGYLNDLAEQYETDGITVRSRHFGYNGQTEYITDTSKFTYPAPWTTSTSTYGGSNVESQGGGDDLYKKDYNQLNAALGTRVAYKVGTTTRTGYWAASRLYIYGEPDNYGWRGLVIEYDGTTNMNNNMYIYLSYGFHELDYNSYALRPIVTLRSDLSYIGDGTIDSPWKIVTR